MMMITEDVVSFQKGLMDWLTEESEYLMQRLDRWTTIARGYNRLYPQRLSRGCMTMQKEPDEESWRHSPSFKILTSSSSRRITRPADDEIRKINCCGTFNYQSNSRVDNSCLEAYRYDHSIYFKTIGDIKSSKTLKETQINEEQVQEEISDFEENSDPSDAMDKPGNICDCPSPMDEEMSEEITWFDKNSSEAITREFTKSCSIAQIDDLNDCINNNDTRCSIAQIDDLNDCINNNDTRWNNFNGSSFQNLEIESQVNSVESESLDNEANVVPNWRKSSRRMKAKPKVLGNNNVSWNNVLFSYNVDANLASSHHCVLNVK
ncbi:GSCOCG00000853001-RA-CDS [Cotesia congregata]|nr:GSCOCG00000853001-RA-CDS [Cotesia congregata]